MDVSWYSAESGGVVSFAGMSGYYAPMQITEERCADIEKISDDTFGVSVKPIFAKLLKVLSKMELRFLNRTIYSQFCWAILRIQ